MQKGIVLLKGVSDDFIREFLGMFLYVSVTK